MYEGSSNIPLLRGPSKNGQAKWYFTKGSLSWKVEELTPLSIMLSVHKQGSGMREITVYTTMILLYNGAILVLSLGISTLYTNAGMIGPFSRPAISRQKTSEVVHWHTYSQWMKLCLTHKIHDKIQCTCSPYCYVCPTINCLNSISECLDREQFVPGEMGISADRYSWRSVSPRRPPQLVAYPPGTALSLWCRWVALLACSSSYCMEQP